MPVTTRKLGTLFGGHGPAASMLQEASLLFRLTKLPESCRLNTKRAGRREGGSVAGSDRSAEGVKTTTDEQSTCDEWRMSAEPGRQTKRGGRKMDYQGASAARYEQERREERDRSRYGPAPAKDGRQLMTIPGSCDLRNRPGGPSLLPGIDVERYLPSQNGSHQWSALQISNAPSAAALARKAPFPSSGKRTARKDAYEARRHGGTDRSSNAGLWGEERGHCPPQSRVT